MRLFSPWAASVVLAACAAPSVDPAALDRSEWVTSDDAAFVWRTDADGRAQLALTKPASYHPPVRAPQGIALRTRESFADFEVSATVQQDGREYPHRDLCLFFAYRDPTHFGYVHLASAADDNAHGVFLVDGAPRRQVTTKRGSGVVWGEPTAWHQVRLLREGKTLRVWFDDAPEPVMEADASAFGEGYLGFGEELSVDGSKEA